MTAAKHLFKRLLQIILAAFLLLNIVVMFHAYKFTHYYEPGEVTIKNPAEKNNWDRTKDLLFGFDAAKKENTLPDSAFETVYLKTANNLKLEGWLIPVPNAKGTVALFHGHGGNKSGVLAEAYAFRRMGYSAFLLDFRAHGNSEGHTSTIGFKEWEDVELAYDYLRRKGEKNIILWGISLGAATIIKSISDYGIAPSKIILEMPFGSLPEAVRGRVKIMGLPAEPISTLLTFWGGVEHGFWAFNMRPATFAKKIKCPVLLQWGRHDPRVTQKETNDIFNNVSSPKKLVVYEDCGHESLYGKEPAKWITEVSAFLP